MKNWKTTLAGIGAILVALGAAAKAFASGGIAAIDLATTLASLSAGFGLIFASDSKSGSATP
jgi:hypothetical protein